MEYHGISVTKHIQTTQLLNTVTQDSDSIQLLNTVTQLLNTVTHGISWNSMDIIEYH